MDRYAVVGNPVEHSRSPTIHTLFAQQTGQALQYEKLLSPLDGFSATVKAFAQAGGRGCNVTVPFKFEAFAMAASASDRAALAGAANTLRFDASGWWADNTDGVGLVRDIEHNAGVVLAGRRVLLAGAGGAAAGVLGLLLLAGPSQLVLTNRTLAKADALAARHAVLARRAAVVFDVRPPHACGEGFDVVINASASSLVGGDVPMPSTVLQPGALAVDLMYGAGAAGFLRWARQHGAQGRDGLGMLVEQAAEAFKLWRGVAPETAPVLAALRKQIDVHA